MITKQATVRGKVQNVGFRAYVRRKAEERGIVGMVCNVEDGSVRVVAQHADSAAVEELMHLLYLGPGRVDSVTWVDFEADPMADFSIGHTAQK